MSRAYRFFLEGLQQEPTVSTSANGFGTLVFDTASTTAAYTLTVTGLDFNGFLGIASSTPGDPLDDINGFHIHTGARRVNGGVVFDIFGNADDDATAVLNADGSVTVRGIWEASEGLSPAIATTFGGGTIPDDVGLYFNIHTNRFGGGEIRGQLETQADDAGNVINGSFRNEVVAGVGGDDTLSGGIGTDLVLGGDGNDVLRTAVNDASQDTFDGGDGIDVVQGSTGAVFIDLLNAPGFFADDGVFFPILNVEGAEGGTGSLTPITDFLLGDNAGNLFRGSLGNDALLGRGGDDTLEGGGEGTAGQDDDLVMGGAAYDPTETGTGNDILRGGAGRDILYGMDGNDTVEGGTGPDFVLAGAGEDSVQGGDGDDFLFAGAEYLQNVPGSGNDTMRGGEGVDFIVGGTGADNLDGEGGNDIINGGDGTDTVSGSAGNDSLFGDGGNDTVAGGAGFDFIRGGAGADTFVFRVGDSFDTVFEFGRTDIDKIRLDPAFGITSFAQFQGRLVTFQSEGVDFSQIAFATVVGGTTVFDQLTIGGLRPDQFTAAMFELG